MIKIILYISIVLNIFLICSSFILKRKISIAQKLKNELTIEKSKIENVLLKSYEFSNFKLDNIKSNEDNLYLFISKRHCSICVDSSVQYYSNYIEKFGSANLKIISDLKGKIIMGRYKDLGLKNQEYIELSKDCMLNHVNQPLFFILNSNSEYIQYPFFPIKGNNDLCEKYFDIINKHFFKF